MIVMSLVYICNIKGIHLIFVNYLILNVFSFFMSMQFRQFACWTIRSNFYAIAFSVSSFETCIGALGIQDARYFTSRTIRYYPFYF